MRFQLSTNNKLHRFKIYLAMSVLGLRPMSQTGAGGVPRAPYIAVLGLQLFSMRSKSVGTRLESGNIQMRMMTERIVRSVPDSHHTIMEASIECTMLSAKERL